MKAALFYAPHEPLSIEEVPTPAPGPGEILVQVAACGVCHTDLHYIDHGTPTFKKPPLILGHEISGVVAAIGPGVTGFHESDRVLLPAIFTCGSCASCRAGRENICAHMVMPGNDRDGGYAEYVVAPARDAFHLPVEIPLVAGAIIADAITTPYHAVVNRGRVTPGDWVAVIGCGGIGLNIVQIAATIGAHVIAVDIVDQKLAWAAQFGAEATINALQVERLDKEIQRITGAAADVAFEAIGAASTQQQALACLRTGGRLVLVGYNPLPMSLNAGRVMYRELEVVGSLGCRPADYPRVIELARRGRIKVAELVTHTYRLDAINQALDTLRTGPAIRVVVVP